MGKDSKGKTKSYRGREKKQNNFPTLIFNLALPLPVKSLKCLHPCKENERWGARGFPSCIWNVFTPLKFVAAVNESYYCCHVGSKLLEPNTFWAPLKSQPLFHRDGCEGAVAGWLTEKSWPQDCLADLKLTSLISPLDATTQPQALRNIRSTARAAPCFSVGLVSPFSPLHASWIWTKKKRFGGGSFWDDVARLDLGFPTEVQGPRFQSVFLHQLWCNSLWRGRRRTCNLYSEKARPAGMMAPETASDGSEACGHEGHFDMSQQRPSKLRVKVLKKNHKITGSVCSHNHGLSRGVEEKEELRAVKACRNIPRAHHYSITPP